MKSENNIKKFFGKAAVDTNPKKDKKVLNKILAAQTKTNIWRLIMKNPVTKYAAAACIVMSLIYFTFLPEQYAWADVIKALNNTDNIHVVLKRTDPNNQVYIKNTWLKNKTMFREEESDEITIDNGEQCLILDINNRTTQLSDSRLPFVDYTEGGLFEFILLFTGTASDEKAEELAEDYKAEELPNERTTTERIFDLTYQDVWIGKARIDAKSNLPIRIVINPIGKHKKHVLSVEISYDYEPISLDVFSLDIPVGYTELPRAKSKMFSGRVIDHEGNPVEGAEIVTSDRDLENIKSMSDEKGEFTIKLNPERSLNGFPKIIRAINNNDPNHVAWTLLRNPRHEPEPLFTPDDGKTKSEIGDGLDINLSNETTLREFIPENSGTFIFESEEDQYPSQVIDIELKMQPASVLTGRITDRNGQPIQNAIIWLDNMMVAIGENEIEIHGIGQTNKEKKIASDLRYEDTDDDIDSICTLTDEEGYYVLGNIPDIWNRARLEVRANGYVQVAKEISQNEGNDFVLLDADVTIRGTVIDNQGNPVVGREVEIDIDSDEIGDLDIEEFYTDSEGKFELKGIPEVDGLELKIRTDEKPRDWEENELTKDHGFIYYRMIEETIKFEPGKKEYTINIEPHMPDIKIEIEVKDSNGKVLEGIPAGICASGYSEHVWFTTKLCGVTDKNGLCIIEEVPNIDPLKIWVCIPPRPELWEDDDESEVNQQVKNAISETGKKYYHIEEKVDWQQDKKNYKIPITLN
ncbi:MAG: carboxypeptidase regulatory-like domain-containing protein [Sedimentisphaerales bacterium]|nr:carboxypeptidase regulatory-like domain-containing protein [Sedimentisphaerales bacterium]